MSGSGGGDWRDRALARGARLVAKPLLASPLPWGLHRAALHMLAAMRPLPRGLTISSGPLGPTRARRVRPEAPLGRLLWLHGGGFVLGSPETHAPLTDTLARAGFEVVVPAYRLAPEHPFPAAYDDCLGAARALAAEGPFSLGGDSAGGGLAAAVLAQLLADGTPPERVMLIAPAADFDSTRPDPPGADDLVLSRPVMERIGRDYARGHDPRDPRLSPIHAEFPGCPPVLIHCARGELLEGDCDTLAERMRAFGGSVTVHKAEGLPHVWHMAAGSAPAADASLAEIADWLKEGA